jgi:hypothetical protein
MEERVLNFLDTCPVTDFDILIICKYVWYSEV